MLLDSFRMNKDERPRIPIASSNPHKRILPYYKEISPALPLEVRHKMLAKQLTQPFHQIPLRAVTERSQSETSVRIEFVPD